MVDTLMVGEQRRIPCAGTVVAGKYLVERVLGVGGMGAVVAGHDLRDGRLVAIKFLLPQCADEPQLVVRFEREARATERLRSEHVRQMLEAGVDAAGNRYIVMEYLDGEDLRALVKREGPLDPRRAADYVAQACRALAEAHALGIVHRDLKPANLFLARAPDGGSVVKVVDFGVAKFESPNVAGDAQDMTAAELVLGSRHFMAPEQILSPRSVDGLADVWALGAILYYLLVGRTPFAAPTVDEVTLNLLCEPPHPLEELRPDLPPRLVAVVMRCLQRDRTRRYPNAIELLRALAPLAREARDDEEEAPRSVRGLMLRTQDLAHIVLPSRPPSSRPRSPPPRSSRSKRVSAPRRAAPGARAVSDLPLAAALTAAGLLALALLAVRLKQPIDPVGAAGAALVAVAEPPRPAPASPSATEAATASPVLPATTARPSPAPALRPALRPDPREAPFRPHPGPAETTRRAAPPTAGPVAAPTTSAAAPAPAAPTSHRIFDVEH